MPGDKFDTNRMNGNSAANTGDDTPIGMYLAEMVGAAAAIALAARKKENDVSEGIDR